MRAAIAQAEMFDSPLTTSVKGETALMEFPFFDLSKNGRKTPFTYDDGKVTISIKAPDGNVATIYDKDILIYIASLMVAKINAGETTSQTFTFTAHDYMRVTGKDPSGSAYEAIAKSLERLQGTQIKTNIETGGEGITGFFSWLEKAEINYTVSPNGKKKMRSITVRVCDFIYRAIQKDRRFLTYHPEYFDLSPLERRIYEISRKHCGRQDCFKISLAKLQSKTGSNSALRTFKQELYKISARNSIPDYMIGIVGDPRSDVSKSLAADGFVRPARRQSINDLIVYIMPKNSAVIERAIIGEAR